MSLRKRKVSNVASRTGKKIWPQAGNSRVRTRLKNGFFIFLYRNIALYYTSEDFGRSTKVSAIAKEKTIEMLRRMGMKVSAFP